MSKSSAEFTAAAARKPQFYFFVGFVEIKNSLANSSLIFENSSPKDLSWQNISKSVFFFSFKNQFSINLSKCPLVLNNIFILLCVFMLPYSPVQSS